MSRRRASFRAGVVHIVPFALAGVPFGLVFGVAASESTVDRWVAVSSSWWILAGAAQLSLLDLIDDGAAWTVAVGTALVINARFALYSAALAPSFRPFPPRWRVGLAYLLTDQAASVGLQHADVEPDPVVRRWFLLGAAMLFASSWWMGTVAGAVLGGTIPDEAQVEFAVPLMFVALLVPNLSRRPAIVAAVVAATTTLLAVPLPAGVNILIGALTGIAAGRVVAT